MDTVLIIDSCCDLPLKFVEENNFPGVYLTTTIGNNTYEDSFGGSISHEEFYSKMRAGEQPTTSQINTFKYMEIFTKFVMEKKPIFYIGFSSALSGSLNNAIVAKNAIIDKFPYADITIIDSKCASLGEGLLIYYAYNMLKSSHPKDEVEAWVEENKLKLNHWFTVSDLNYLKRGGRISSATAVVGTLLDIKPILHVDNEGRLMPVTKVKGRKKSLKMLADMLFERIVNPEESVIAISHGDCLEDALYLQKIILEKVKVKDVIINNVGPVIGSHSGPGTVALFFFGEKR
ncbi:MAG: DegV family protein [Bacillota bacterium]|nr:DegV family protein [Bacillota bacterium]